MNVNVNITITYNSSGVQKQRAVCMFYTVKKTKESFLPVVPDRRK